MRRLRAILGPHYISYRALLLAIVLALAGAFIALALTSPRTAEAHSLSCRTHQPEVMLWLAHVNRIRPFPSVARWPGVVCRTKARNLIVYMAVAPRWSRHRGMFMFQECHGSWHHRNGMLQPYCRPATRTLR